MYIQNVYIQNCYVFYVHTMSFTTLLVGGWWLDEILNNVYFFVTKLMRRPLTAHFQLISAAGNHLSCPVPL